MIINRVWAEHVLKYAELELNHLPEEGLIAISGPNESGKSTIGEIICFAMFGRTFSLPPDDIIKIIRWGEPHCAATVAFTVDGQHYELSRFLDDNGTQGARLAKRGDDESVVRGVNAVDDALATLLGFGFNEFVESFYLAQREITTPHPHSTAVKRMAGIAELEQVVAVAASDIEHARTSITEINNQILECEDHIADLAFDEERLSQLEAAHQEQVARHTQDTAKLSELETTLATYENAAVQVATAAEPLSDVELATPFQEWQTHVSRLDDALAAIEQLPHDGTALTTPDLQASVQDVKAYLAGIARLKERVGPYRTHLAQQLGEHVEEERRPQNDHTLPQQQEVCRRAHNHTKRRYTTMRTGFFILTVLAILGWLALGLVGFGSDVGLTTWLVGAAAAVCTAGAVFCGIRCRTLHTQLTQLSLSSRDLEERINAAHREAQVIDTIDTTPLHRAVDALEYLRDSGIKDAVLQLKTGVGEAFLDAKRLNTFKATLRDRTENQHAYLQTACEHTTATIATVKADIASRENERQELVESLSLERERRKTYDELQARIDRHHADITAHNHRIAVRLLACELVTGGCHHIAKIFNRDIRGLVSRTLPLLTEGRYEHLKLDENLDVQVFSRDKQDFMYFEEISSGTQRQIMLALRLALSQEFINTTLNRQQFLFLDEPFAFFDQERTRAALRVLPNLSHEMRQIWLVAQTFPDSFECKVHIHCAKEHDRLSLDGV